MPGTHGDLFREIGALVVAAHGGQTFDLTQTSEELARCYVNLGVPADTIARAIARSMAAVSVSMAMMKSSERDAIDGNGFAQATPASRSIRVSDPDRREDEVGPRSTAMVFPSGVRLAVLS